MRHVDTFRAFAPTRAERPRAPKGREGGPSFLSSALPGKLSLLQTANSDACYWQADKAAQSPHLLTSNTCLLARDILFGPGGLLGQFDLTSESSSLQSNRSRCICCLGWPVVIAF